ncbi:MAG: kelch repeat-containing protein, partial [Candidatus Acidiferrales bacterium]
MADAGLFGTDGSFSAAAPMNVARSMHISVALQDGRVLVAGGTTTGGGTTNAAEIYDPLTNTWASVAGGMVEARSGHTASLLADGRVLIAAGQGSSGTVSSTLEIFDPGTGAFSSAGVLSSPRKAHAAGLLSDGRVLIVGGSDGSKPLASSDLYDPSTGTVSAGPVLSTPRQGLSATTQLDGKVVVIGGNTVGATGASVDLASAEVYDPAAQPPANFAVLNSTLATPRQGHLAFLLPHNNNVLIVGGTSAGTALASVELYRPWTGSFSTTGSMASARSGATGSALSSQDGLLLVAGGKDASGASLSSTDVYGFATVKTDQADYTPGTTVIITGTGWQPGETVTLTVQEVPFIDIHGPFTAVADASGNIFNNQLAMNAQDINVRFYLTAAGSVSQAQTTFTDASNLVSVAVAAQTGTLTYGTAASATYMVTVTRSGAGSLDVALSITTSLPSGATASFSPSTVSFTGNTPTSKTSILTISTTTATPAGATAFTVQGVGDTTKTAAGTLTVNKAHLMVTANPQTRAYGAANPTLTATISGFVNGQTLGTSGVTGTASCTTTAVATSSVSGSPYPITCTIGTLAAGNYDFPGGNFIAGNLTVTKAHLTVTADPQTRAYGAANPTFTATLSGFQNGET